MLSPWVPTVLRPGTDRGPVSPPFEAEREKPSLCIVWAQRGRQFADFQELLYFSFAGLRSVLQFDDLACFQRGDGDAVAHQDAIGPDRWDARAGRENADKVQRIGGAQGNQCTAGFFFPSRAQKPDGVGCCDVSAT